MIVFKFVFLALAVNPLAELFAKEGSLDSDSLKDLRVDFIRDFSGYVDNLLAPEKRATNPSSSDIINGFGLENDNQYNEFQSVSVVSEVNGCR
jgi:hypothetical protein